jgi:hypothetical protein
MYYNSLSFGGKYDDETYAAWHQPYMILYVENREYSIYATGANATYAFTFHGLYDESTGQQESDGVNVTATYQNGTAPSTFTVNGEYIFYSYESLPPLYFSFALSGGTREYWLSPTNIISNIYIFNATTLSQYHVTFIDLGNILSMSPYVEVDRNINGSMMAVEKQLVDKTLTINPLLVQNATYSLTLYDHNTYIIGNFVADGSSSIQIPITNIAFPNSVTLAYQYVRMYAERTTSQISMIYQDVTLDTLNVVFIITESNGNIVYTTTQYSDNLNVTWAVANESLTYFIKIDATTSDYGLLSYRNTLYPTSANSVNGFGLPLGKVNGLDLSVLFPTLILFCFALIFSQVNAHFGAIAVSGLAVFFAWFGWLPISSSMIVFALTMSVLYFLSARKRRDIFY